jgi:pyruvate ferredoxin oxidoreductase alpha subunit
MKKIISASEAIALGVKLCKPKVISIYPITPQTMIPERIADFVYNGEFDAELVNVESEHSALSVCLGAQATGIRTFIATASQGLELMHEILFVVSGMRLPVVMAIANRALSAPISIWNDHQDSISARDAGWMQFYVETPQEAIDTVIMAYKVAEDHKILTPAMVCLDGYTLSHVYEPVDIPSQKQVDSFLPKYTPKYKLDPKKPLTMGPIAPPNVYMEIKKEQHEAMNSALPLIKKANSDFKKVLGRKYGDGLIEGYKTKDADFAIVAMGTICGTIRTVVDEFRRKGKRVGLIKLKAFRPFPEERLKKELDKLKGVAVIDRDISVGQEGAVFTEVKSIADIPVHSFIAGLGGRDVRPKHIRSVFKKIEWAKKTKKEWLL